METNPKLELAFNFLEYTGKSVFLTGKAGTGKTTFLKTFKKQSSKRIVILAPTGVAAINAGGVTIHSFFQLPFGPYLPGITTLETTSKKFVNKFGKEKLNIIKSVDLLVIDEISMVRADLLDAVNDVLCRYRDRTKPFGGVQLLMIGDVQQLAPVTKDDEWLLLKDHYRSPFFFSSKSLSKLDYVSVELTHIYRQADVKFINLLNNVRNKNIDNSTLDELNKRYVPGFEPNENDGYITLTTHNYQAQKINTQKLNSLSGESFYYKAETEGDFPEYSFPTDYELELKNDAQVMFIKNDSSAEKRYYNGKIGQVTAIGKGLIWVKCKDEKAIEVPLEEWTNTKYSIDPTTNDIVETIQGVFKQYPLKTAWAITIHKSQGLTFEKAIIDAADSFSHGQVYVALSRCKSLEGVVLNSLLKPNSLVKDNNVDSFSENVKNNQPEDTHLQNACKDYFLDLLKELFDYRPILWSLQHLAKIFEEHLWKLYPDSTANVRAKAEDCKETMFRVGERFQQQLEQLIKTSDNYENNTTITERITKGVSYFSDKVSPLVAFIQALQPEIDNKEVKKQFSAAYEKANEAILLKNALLKEASKGFSVKTYLHTKATTLIEKPKKTKKSNQQISSDIHNPELYEILKKWRDEEAAKLGVPVYNIIQQKAIIGISNTLPKSSDELLKIPGIGKAILKRYGTKILEIIRSEIIK